MAVLSLVTREFSFIQELIWSAPYRNPFPGCSNKLISILKAAQLGSGQAALALDAAMLIELRRALCNVLSGLGSRLTDDRRVAMERELDGMILQHLSSSWEKSPGDGINRKDLSADVKRCLNAYAGEEAADSLNFPAELIEVKVEETEQLGSSLCPPSETSTVPAETAKEQLEALLEVEMTMKARLCESEGRPFWHVIFGLVNHSCCKVEVEALSFWPLGRNFQPTTVKWPKGELCLNEKASFLCYCTKLDCDGVFDSPRLGFSWNYKKSKRSDSVKRSKVEADGDEKNDAEKDAKRQKCPLESDDNGSIPLLQV